MPMRETPSGELIKTGGTKRFNEIQAENAAALNAKLVETVTCGVEATSTRLFPPARVIKEDEKPKTTSLEKVTNG